VFDLVEVKQVAPLVEQNKKLRIKEGQLVHLQEVAE
jgi:hypothetical protein